MNNMQIIRTERSFIFIIVTRLKIISRCWNFGEPVIGQLAHSSISYTFTYNVGGTKDRCKEIARNLSRGLIGGLTASWAASVRNATADDARASIGLGKDMGKDKRRGVWDLDQ